VLLVIGDICDERLLDVRCHSDVGFRFLFRSRLGEVVRPCFL